MEYREHRGLTLSEVGVGGYALAGAYGAVNRGEFLTLLRRAHALGVTLFDTAGNYGDAEAVLGEAVRPFRDEVILATKVGSPEGAPPSLRPVAVRAACRRSLERLGTDRIDLLQVHFDDPATPVEDTVAALEGLRDDGLIRHYGVGHLPAHRVARYLEVGDLFSILMELSAVARGSRRTLLPLCSESNPVAIAFSTTGRGLLSGTIGPGTTFEKGDIRHFDPLFQRARFASGLRVAAYFGSLARSLGMTPSQVAIAWVLAQPGVACALTGPRRLDHLEENLGGSGRRLPEVALAALEARFAEEEATLASEEGTTVDAILDDPLPADPAAAFRDLVYAIETAVGLGRVAEDAIRPVFFDLWPLQENLEGAGPALEGIRVALRRLIPSTRP
ncbi:MAG: aldo/keto reductase [Actinomycetota bacterium]